MPIEPASWSVYGNPIDQDYIRTTGLKLVAGQGITQQDMLNAHPDQRPAIAGGPDTTAKPEYAFILNETAARELGWSPQEAMGKRMFMDESRPGFVTGVVKDFNFQSLHTPIKGLILYPRMTVRGLAGAHHRRAYPPDPCLPANRSGRSWRRGYPMKRISSTKIITGYMPRS